MKPPRCPVCPGFGRLLGSLGHVPWFRCRDCGIDSYRARHPRIRRNPPAAPARVRTEG
jgi:tRNA(Ile2) C34 agmatinyltransferase TiaS